MAESAENQVYALLQQVRALGWVVVAFSPDEMRGTDESHLEDVMIQRGNEYIGNHATVPDIEDLKDRGYEVRPAPAASDYAFDAYDQNGEVIGYATTEDEAWQACHDYDRE